MKLNLHNILSATNLSCQSSDLKSKRLRITLWRPIDCDEYGIGSPLSNDSAFDGILADRF
jgi:hypothetical protein